MTDRRRTTAAERTRRWRARQRAGVRLVNVPASDVDLDDLRRLRLLCVYDDASDREIGDELGRLLRRIVDAYEAVSPLGDASQHRQK